MLSTEFTGPTTTKIINIKYIFRNIKIEKVTK